jgi:hypothetical protein
MSFKGVERVKSKNVYKAHPVLSRQLIHVSEVDVKLGFTAAVQ